jgi:hypothetical protein
MTGKAHFLVLPMKCCFIVHIVRETNEILIDKGF